MSQHVTQSLDERQKAYWKKNTSLIRNLLIIWVLVSLVGSILLAGLFHGVPFFGVTLAFWLAQQGSILVFVILIFFYAKRMDRLDQELIQGGKTSSNQTGGTGGGSE